MLYRTVNILLVAISLTTSAFALDVSVHVFDVGTDEPTDGRIWRRGSDQGEGTDGPLTYIDHSKGA